MQTGWLYHKLKCMEDKNKAFRIGLMLVGVLLGLASILSVFIDEGGSDLMNFTLGAGRCFALSEALFPKRMKYTWLYVLVLWVLVTVASFVKFNVNQGTWQFVGILLACLFVPYVLVLIIRRLPIKEIYKATLYLGFLPFLAFILVGQWGNNAIVMAIAFVTLPAFYYATRNSTAKQRWIQLVFFMLPILLTHIAGYLGFVVPRLIALVVSLLLVMLLQSMSVSTKAKTVVVAVLMLLSLPLSFFLSTNLFTYFIVKEMDGEVEQPFPLSYTIVTKEGDTLNEATLLGKNVALFFWSSHCANCHKELPNFSDLAAQYEGDTTKVFIAAFISFDEEPDSAFFEQESSTEMAFLWAKATNGKKLMNDLGFNAFPYVTYINRNGEVVYKGFLTNHPGVLAYPPKKYLKL